MANRAYRIRTEVPSVEKYIDVPVQQSYGKFEILSLEIDTVSMYKKPVSDTGIIVGRVLANGGFGIPNARVSVFVPCESEERLRSLYPYSRVSDTDADGVRYNLLPSEAADDCDQPVGTFPGKTLLLDNDAVIEVFEKYYKYTTRTNNSGDYMIYGIPVGMATIHCDVDLSDIGILSQRPIDMIYKGYSPNMFDSPGKFKHSTDLSSLPQIVTQDSEVYVYPFWGDTGATEQTVAITRCDVRIPYKFEPTCVFLGSVMTDTYEDSVNKRCVPSEEGGKMSKMVPGRGCIEMIRKTPDGSVEQISVRGDELIDEDGVWCYQIPMNLDYVMTDEYGGLVASDSPEKGIATRSRVRFRIRMNENPYDGMADKRARYLVPNNPSTDAERYPEFNRTGDADYEFGSRTREEDFRDIMWNNVYTVKSYIPRIQRPKEERNKKYTGIKGVNHHGHNSPMPYNRLSIKFNFMYSFMCILIRAVVEVVKVVNSFVTALGVGMYRIGTWLMKNAGSGVFKKFIFSYKDSSIDGSDEPIKKWEAYINEDCLGEKSVEDAYADRVLMFIHSRFKDSEKKNDVVTADSFELSGLGVWFLRMAYYLCQGFSLPMTCDDGVGDDESEEVVRPGCSDKAKEIFDETKGYPCTRFFVYTDDDELGRFYNCVENMLAQENESISYNFYNDWVNGVLYFPLWHRQVRRSWKGKSKWCEYVAGEKTSKGSRAKIKLFSNMAVSREADPGAVAFKPIDDVEGVENMNLHKKSVSMVRLNNGLIVEKTTIRGEKVQYYAVSDAYDEDEEPVRLFASDLVLLGSLSECDIHGIPQFFRILTGTTYRIPPMLVDDDEVDDDESENGDTLSDARRITETTGSDWGSVGYEQAGFNAGKQEGLVDKDNIHDNGGLFYSITCVDSYTKPKSVINLERICEVGVSLEESLESESGERMAPDGFISYDEVTESDYRSMFVTMNANGLKTKINSDTGLHEYDMEHIYTDNFDGALSTIMNGGSVNGPTGSGETASYRYNYRLETADPEYAMFRFGDYTKMNGEIPYAYKGSGEDRAIPKYENSFYFYFGLKPGSTAIDKFYSEYYTACATNENLGRGFDMDVVPNSWCCDEYDGYVVVRHHYDVPVMMSLRCLDDDKNYESEYFMYEDFYFGAESQDVVDAQYVALKDLSDNLADSPYILGLPNGRYILSLADNDGEKHEYSFLFDGEKCSFDVEVHDFKVDNDMLESRFSSQVGITESIDSSHENHYSFSKEEKQLIIINTHIGRTSSVTTVAVMGDDGRYRRVRDDYDVVYSDDGRYWVTHNGYEVGNVYNSFTTSYISDDGREIKKNIYRYYNDNQGGTINDFDYPIKEDNLYCVIADYKGSGSDYREDIGGYIVVKNISGAGSVYEIRLSYNVDGCEAPVVVVDASGNSVSVSKTGCGYDHCSCISGTPICDYYIGVPKGNMDYSVTVSQICGENQKNKDNSTTKIVRVNTGWLNLKINGVDYDLIKNFESGYDDFNLILNENASEFYLNNVVGWNKMDDIGISDIINNHPDTFNGSDGIPSVYKKYQSTIPQFIKPDISGCFGSAVCGIKLHNYASIRMLYNALSPNYNCVPDSDNDCGCAYNWGDDCYVMVEMLPEADLAYNVTKTTKVEDNSCGRGECGSLEVDGKYWRVTAISGEGSIFDVCEDINRVIANRMEYARKAIGAFTCMANGKGQIVLDATTNSYPITYTEIMVNNRFNAGETQLEGGVL